jgi:hypothetical protein
MNVQTRPVEDAAAIVAARNRRPPSISALYFAPVPALRSAPAAAFARRPSAATIAAASSGWERAIPVALMGCCGDEDAPLE